MSSHALPRAARGLLYLSILALVILPSPALIAQNAAQDEGRSGAAVSNGSANGNGAPRAPLEPNYAAAAAWMPQKVSKLVFDTTVSPRWLEKSDRFWYAYETREGRKFYLVDPAKKSKVPLFDHAKMAAALTTITGIPYDAQHLPFSTVRFVKDDTAFEFDVRVPADAKITVPKPPITTDEQQGNGNGSGRSRGDDAAVDDPQQTQGNRGQVQGQRGRQGGRGGREGGPSRPRTRTLTFEYDIATGNVALLPERERERPVRWASLSPDGKTVLFARNHNLYMMDAENFEKAKKNPNDPTIVEVQLTKDGEKYYSYARNDGSGRGDNQREQEEEEEGDRQEIEEQGDEENRRTAPVAVIWSRDSSRFALIRRDTRKVKDLWVIDSLANPRPTLETYRYAMPGEEHVPQSEMHVFTVATTTGVKVKADRFKDQTLSIATKPRRAAAGGRGGGRGGGGGQGTPPPPAEWLSDSPEKIYFTRQSRDMHRLDVAVADAATGEVTTLIEERLNTYIDTKPLRLVNNQTELIFWSERDGWGHLYRYDAATGQLKNRITQGEFVVTDLDHVDEANRMLYITAAGREKDEDPYYTHLYRVGFDGTGMTLLNPGNATHSTSMPESGRYFVNNASRVDMAPTSTLHDAQGAPVLDLETPDLSALMEVGFKFPEPFTVKADDGVTDLYGVMYKPFDFDPNRKYPIIAYVYPGPQTESVTKTFNPRSSNISLAQFGFIVIEVGNRGGHPTRSKWYHNYGYGNLRDYGLADKKAAIEQLARRHSFIDIEKVGIWGHSGGGFMTAAAMLVYPDFFKVGWSESGNHENNIYNHRWSEKHHGIKEIERDGEITFEYDIEKNSELAKNLKGRLMLITGDIDNNVHPAATYRLADALIKANKRFDMFVLPGVRHSFGPVSGYVNWLRGDYFARHLLGKAADSVDIVELNREIEQTGDRDRR